MRQILLLSLIFELLCVVGFSQTPRKIRSLIVVAADGTGDFKTVQEAVDHIPENNQQRILIRIKPGVYNEQKARVAWSRQLAAGEAETFSTARFFSRADRCQPNVRFKLTETRQANVR